MKNKSELSPKEASRLNERSKGILSQIKQQTTRKKVLLIGLIIVVITLPNLQPKTDQNTAPDFVLRDINGKKVTLSDFGGSIVILEFFATWCSFCREEKSELVRLSQITDNRVVIISLSVDPNYDTDNRLSTYADVHDISWILVRDTKGVAQNYGIEAIPSIIIINPNQQISWRNTGLVSSDILIQHINQFI